MKWTGVNELREQFLSFFESKGHTRLLSAALVPKNDKSLLLINSGMAPFKKYFLGLETPPNNRVTTCQKCIRTPDIDRVGKTSRHGTYFEMLGNFSFGDYFKIEATAWAWEFLTKTLEIPADRLWISIFEDDDEAFDIWTKQVGIPPQRIVRLGREDNFWEHGTGPCGPCSEIYFDRGEGVGCGRPECAVGCDCDRYMEIWNLVFSQFDSDGNGNYQRMAKPNIDTGMGLERLACVMQGVANLFEIDTVQNIMKHVSDIAKVHYHDDSKTDVSLRVITDHIRSTTFMVGDGIIPSNEGRGYVLRRLLRRAARHGRLLGIEGPFLFEVAKTVIHENISAYPELAENQEYIVKVISAEEDRFQKTINQGMDMLMGLVDKFDCSMEKIAILSGEDAFKLYDTYGFPLDLTREILGEKGIDINEDQFTKLMEQQRIRAREARKDISGWNSEDVDINDIPTTTFTGYNTTTDKGTILAIIKDGELVENIQNGDKATILLNSTPFYGESGGQVGDIGTISNGDNLFIVADTKKDHTGHFFHEGILKEGSLSTSDDITARVDDLHRRSIMSNHSVCHLLQAALRQILGTHVHQAGSYYDATRCRFDFSHFSAMTAEEISQTECLVNQMILSAIPVTIEELPIEQAKDKGAMALFGEKYGNLVRVCTMGDKSVEFCGGTHVHNTSEIGVFKIISEASVAAGVRRIEASTGIGILHLLQEAENSIHEIGNLFKVNGQHEVIAKVQSIAKELKEKEKTIEELNAKIAGNQVQELFSNMIEIGTVKFISAAFNSSSVEGLRIICDKLKEQAPSVVGVFSTGNSEKATIMAVCGDEAIKSGVHAGKLIKEITEQLGGKGGGRADTAMGGVTDVFRIDEVTAKVPEMIAKLLEK